MSKRSKAVIAALLVAAAVTGTAWRRESRFRTSGADGIVFLDVGQGDAILLRDTDGRTVLVDAGPADAAVGALARELPPWDRDIDLVVMTHLDADHFSGLFGLLDRYRIGGIWWNGAAPTTAGGRRILESIRAHGIPMKVVASGETFDLDRLHLAVIHPDEDLTGRLVADKNATSVSLRVDCGAESALLAGDAPSETEADFLADGDIGDLTLLKASHHGSKHSTSGDFLDATVPEYVVISAGKGNRYGHPSSRVMADLRRRGIRILRTDESGDIAFSCDGRHLSPL